MHRGVNSDSNDETPHPNAPCTTPKLTSKEVDDYLFGFHTLVCGVRELEKVFRGILYATLSIQGFALMLLLVCMDDPLSVGELDAKFLIGLFEMCDSAT